MGVASGHTKCHMTQVKHRGRCGYGGLHDMDGVGPSTTPPLPWGVQSFYKMFGQDTIVGSKCLSCYTGSRQEVGRKYKEKRVSKGFKGIRPCIRPCIRPLNPKTLTLNQKNLYPKTLTLNPKKPKP